ncbi:type III-A CRISPR-associated protein Cas10/Csm1 [Sphaerospermopsis aphanizomenoides BCCUSP55]|uniref:type III-A CRISPR-associated protein Cas10/Csm1 n=1 Tax=Sphaerospermopsis aphanizomenoides TaxID=459663 RepID=UPI001907B6F8|nr:type III-A CRISPR-associated protein Cas10/Csm1 [Sphaerospermopsis aphanizomenoides]MBK1986912.1 type III-A CRISPR-associated protein Cas10/Csm1 [Sphaerospermopsis aphanizomenoides BCCUSP55]
MVTSSQIALQVIQQAIAALAKWAECDYPSPDNKEYIEVTRAKKILGWNENTEVGVLRLLFDRVNLSDTPIQEPSETHYHALAAIKNKDEDYPTIPYPLNYKPDQEAQEGFKAEINQELDKYLKDNWQNLSLLMLILEKFGSCLSFGESDVALVDMARTTAAVAAALIDNPAEEISLIAGDLSGIQKFIYTISADGALKSLRARSFYLELVTEEVVQQLLEELNLPNTNIIYAGGGNFYVIASTDLQQVKKSVNKICKKFNKWLLKSFKGKLFLAIDSLSVPTQAIKEKNFAEYWTKLTKDLAEQKARKFNQEINLIIQPNPSYQPCKVCHRDDLPSLKPLIQGNNDSSRACWMCRNMFELGERLFNVKALLRSKRSNVKGSVDKHIERIYIPGYYYYLCKTREEALSLAKNDEKIILINDWILENYKSKNTSLLLLGNYGKKNEEEKRFIRAEEMAKSAEIVGAIPRVGYLRMDVDKLGRIFAEGLNKNNRTLPRIAGLSRQMSYFFKVYLNSLAETRYANFIQPQEQQNITVLKNAKYLTREKRDHLLFIYAGGDDLFISGAWNEIVEFACDIYQCFRAYTGNNPDITISGGISIDDIKFPLYQAAKSSGDAEDAAKANGRNSLGLFGKAFKWSEWLGSENVNVSDIKLFDYKIKQYLGLNTRLDLFGILPFVKKIQEQNIEINYARSFVRNLLDTAQMQEQKIQEIESKRKKEQYESEIDDIRYYLHLPKIAYTLARLPSEILNNDSFTPVRKSLMSPYNARYFLAIATWIELLNRNQTNDTTTKKIQL